MKKRSFITSATILLLVTLFSCSEEPVGRTPTNHTPPGKVTHIDVTPLPGGAKITYQLPENDDLLYVKAVYCVNGVEKTEAASLYNKSLEVKGFGSTEEQTVRLYCVNRSNVYSEPVEVIFAPDTPPITLIRESMAMQRSFGGVQLTWRNEHKAPVAIYLIAADSVGELKVADIVYTSSTQGKFNLRGFDPTERLFGAYVRDRWDNYSSTLQGWFSPFEEEQLDKKKFRREVLGGDNTSIYGNEPNSWGFHFMYDDIVVTDKSYLFYMQSLESKFPNYFTIDLGVTVKLNRYTLWQRLYENEYLNANPKRWKLYGSATLNLDGDEFYWKEGFKQDWFLLADCYAFKPSGENSPVTQEDRDYALKGHEFDFPLDAPPVKYVRFCIEETWGGTAQCAVNEVTFWGRKGF